MKRLIAILAILISAASCSGRLERDFLESPEVRLSVDNRTLFVYDPLTCQMGYDATDCRFHVMKDNASDYYMLTLSKQPSSEGEHIKGDISWTTSDSIENRKNIAFTVMKLEGDIIWLWNADQRIAVCVKKLI